MLDFTDKRLAPPNENTPLITQVRLPRLALMTAEEGAAAATRVTTAMYGETAEVYAHNGEYALIRLLDDHYVGWAMVKGLGEPGKAPTHKLNTAMSYGFDKADIKSAPRTSLFQNARVTAGETKDELVSCDGVGWVPAAHLSPMSETGDDPAAIALGFYAAPYLWGGNDTFGVDCSGLTQAAFKACGLQMPRDSDMQFAWCGEAIANWQEAGALQRNDLVFWKGHVGIMLDTQTLLHANAHHMATRYEPLSEAITRIAARYGQPIGARRIHLDGTNTAAWHAGSKGTVFAG